MYSYPHSGYKGTTLFRHKQIPPYRFQYRTFQCQVQHCYKCWKKLRMEFYSLVFYEVLCFPSRATSPTRRNPLRQKEIAKTPKNQNRGRLEGVNFQTPHGGNTLYFTNLLRRRDKRLIASQVSRCNNKIIALQRCDMPRH